MQLHCFRAVTAGLRKRMQSGWTTFKFTASIGDGCRVYNHHFSLFNTRVVLTICGWKLQDFNSDLYKIKKHKQEAQINTGAVGTACMHSFCICHSTFIHFFYQTTCDTRAARTDHEVIYGLVPPPTASTLCPIYLPQKNEGSVRKAKTKPNVERSLTILYEGIGPMNV